MLNQVVVETAPPTPTASEEFDVTTLSERLQGLINDGVKKKAYLEYIPYADKLVTKRFTQWQLYCAMSLLFADGESWKEAVRTTISACDYEVCDDACSYYSGGSLEQVSDPVNGNVRVYSAGYYCHIGA